MKNVLSLLLGLNLALAGVASAADDQPLPPKVFAQPDRIHYDGHCLTIDGQDTLIYSGAFHYFRCPKPLWRSRFEKIKAAGFNTVETYVPWNWHEQQQPAGLDDFSKVDLTDLKDFLKMAEDEFGLYVIIRPGPYICAEWDGGGYPRWLLNFKPAQPLRSDMWLRSDDPTYLAWSKHWYDAVCPVLAAEQLTRKSKGAHGIILFQIENEYDFNHAGNREQKENHLRALYQYAQADGIEVPIMTCWTKEIRGSHDPLLSQIFDGANEYPRWKVENVYRDVMKAKSEQPNAPGMVPELQGGWFAQLGGILSEDQDGVTASEINAVTLMAYAGGATITSYYMLYGGIHVDGWAARTLTTTYDYNAPIREHGGVGDRYFAVAAIGNFIKAHGPELARTDLIHVTSDNTDTNLFFKVRRNPDGQTFVFCFNSDRNAPRSGSVLLKPDSGDPIPVKYALDAFGMKVLCLPSGEWQPQPVAPPERPTDPAPVRIASALTRPDKASQGWHPVPAGEPISQLGIFDARFVLYRAQVSLTAEQLTNLSALQLNLFRGDSVVVRVNGRLLPDSLRDGRQKNFDAENGALLKKAAAKPASLRLNLAGTLQAGDNEIVVLYENAGQANGGKPMEELAGLKSGQLTGTDAKQHLPLNWELSQQLDGMTGKWYAPATVPEGWTPAPLDVTSSLPVKKGEMPSGPATDLATWYRLEFTLPAAAPHTWAPWGVVLQASGNGWIYLNDQPLGRYWEAGPQRKFYLPECWLKTGEGEKNILTLCLRPTAKGATLNGAEVQPYAGFAETR
jgi:hypothetical protein